MPFKIISSKQYGAVYKVLFEFSGSYSSARKEIVINIHDFAFIKFLLDKGSGSANCGIETQVKKTELAKDLTIIVTCSKDGKAKQLTCLEEWSNWTHLSSADINKPFILDLSLTISKVNRVPILYGDTNFTDIELKADDGTVAVHRALLAAHSHMFKTMLLGSWKETQEGKIELEGLTRETLQHFKDYMYLGTLPEVGLQPLLLLAIRYLVDTLKLETLLKISMTVTEDNLHDLLNFAIQHECHELLHNLLQKTPEDVLVAAFNKKRPISDIPDTD